MDQMQQQWFLNGHDWTLSILELCGMTVDRTKLREVLQSIRDGSLCTTDSLTERIARIEEDSRKFGISLSEEDMQRLVGLIRSIDTRQREVATRRDIECASLILDVQDGLWPKLEPA